MTAQLLDFIQTAPLATLQRLGRVEPGAGPRCYLCNRLFRSGDRMLWVATGPGQERTRFRIADEIDRSPLLHSLSDAEYHDHDSIYVGAECVRRYVPKAAVIREEIR